MADVDPGASAPLPTPTAPPPPRTMPQRQWLWSNTSSTSPFTLSTYFSISTALFVGMIAQTIREQKQFVPIMVTLQNHQFTVMVVCNFFLILCYFFFRGVQHAFFGPLRAIEKERLVERCWFVGTQTIFAASMFRTAIDTYFVLHISWMLMLKGWHWILQDRVDFMEQRIMQPRFFFIRMNLAIVALGLIDAIMVRYTLPIILVRADVTLFFGVEYIMLSVHLLHDAFKYMIQWQDAGREGPPSEAKSVKLFYLEFMTNMARLATYLFFCFSIYRHYGLPIYLIRDVWILVRDCIRQVNDVLNYQRARRDLEAKYPDATTEDIQRGDALCVVCREEMMPHASAGEGASERQQPKKLPCGHIFHYHCLRSWLERQQACPTCRRPLLQTAPATATPAPAATSVPPTQPSQTRPSHDRLRAAWSDLQQSRNATRATRRTDSTAEHQRFLASLPNPLVSPSAHGERLEEASSHHGALPSHLAGSLVPLLPLDDFSGPIDLDAISVIPPVSETADLTAQVEERLAYLRRVDRQITSMMAGLTSFLSQHGSPRTGQEVPEHREEDAAPETSVGETPFEKEEVPEDHRSAFPLFGVESDEEENTSSSSASSSSLSDV